MRADLPGTGLRVRVAAVDLSKIVSSPFPSFDFVYHPLNPAIAYERKSDFRPQGLFAEGSPRRVRELGLKLIERVDTVEYTSCMCRPLGRKFDLFAAPQPNQAAKRERLNDSDSQAYSGE